MRSAQQVYHSAAGTDSGNLGNYLGVSAVKPFINNDLTLGELLEKQPS
jgi:hypothetical protein